MYNTLPIILGLSILGCGYYLQGDIENALKHTKKGLKLHESSGREVLLSFHYFLLSMILADSGDYGQARAYAEKGLELSERNFERHLEALCNIALGRVIGKIDSSQLDKAEKHFLKGIGILEEYGMRSLSPWGYFFLGELRADFGQKDNALQSLKKAEALSEEMGVDYWLVRTQEVLERL